MQCTTEKVQNKLQFALADPDVKAYIDRILKWCRSEPEELFIVLAFRQWRVRILAKRLGRVFSQRHDLTYKEINRYLASRQIEMPSFLRSLES